MKPGRKLKKTGATRTAKPRTKQKSVWSRKDRRGPADIARYVGSGKPTKDLRTDPIGLNPKARNLGGVPAGPIAVGRAHRAGGAGSGGGPGTGGGGTCPVNVQRQSSTGPLLTKPKIVLLWWSTYFWDVHNTEKHYYRNALSAFGNDSAFWNRLSEYGITSGSYSGTIDLTRFGGPSASLTEQAIRDALTYRFNVSNVTPDAETIYVVMLPNGVTSQYDTSSGFIGHHQTYTYNGQNVWYAVVEYSTDTRQTLSVITHEVYEAATDPDVSTGYWDPANGGETEIGDLCNLQTMVIDGYPVQQVWSQKGCDCI
jgi:hypothetical protein